MRELTVENRAGIIRQSLRKRRERKGITIKQVAELLKKSQRFVRYVENGERNFKSREDLKKLEKVYDLDYSDLVLYFADMPEEAREFILNNLERKK